MPIRFVCSNCHQRLSVRPEKAGQPVKCPKCRQVVPVPAEPPTQAEIESTPANSGSSSGPPGAFSEFAVVDRPDELIYQDDVPPGNEPVRSDAVVAVPRHVIYVQGFLLGAVALLFFVFGLIVGGRSASQTNSMAIGQPCIISGRVTHADSQQRKVADEGSALFLVPSAVRPDEKVFVDGLRVDDPPPTPGDRGVTAIHDLGGDLARTDPQGKFRLRVPIPGRYFLLVVSQNANRSSESQPEPQELAEMGRYFLPAVELLGQHRYEWREVLIETDCQIDTAF